MDKCVSVIIPTYNDWDRLKLCLEALSRQTYPLRLFEVIIINNDPSQECPYELPAYNMAIINEASPGSYAARNSGIKKANGKYLAFTDSDCIPDTAWIESAVNRFRNSPVNRIAGAVWIFPLKSNPSYINKYESMFAIRQDRFSKLNKASTANLFCEKSLFDSVGLFDDSQYSGEDHEWNLRASDAGYTLCYDQACLVLHPARNINQIMTKTKRLFPNYLKKLTTIRSNSLLFLYGPYLIRPPFRYIHELLENKKDQNLGYIEMLRIFVLIYRIRFIQFFTHYNLLFGGNKERL